MRLVANRGEAIIVLVSIWQYLWGHVPGIVLGRRLAFGWSALPQKRARHVPFAQTALRELARCDTPDALLLRGAGFPVSAWAEWGGEWVCSDSWWNQSRPLFDAISNSKKLKRVVMMREDCAPEDYVILSGMRLRAITNDSHSKNPSAEGFHASVLAVSSH